MNKNIVYIILINYNNWQDTIECLNSLQSLDYEEFKVVVVDVCNLDNSLVQLNNYAENSNLHIKILNLDVNNGFAYANNYAIQYIKSANDFGFFWILNNDTIVQPDALSELVDFYNREINKYKIGFVGSKILDYNERSKIQSVGGMFDPKTGISKLVGKGEIDNKQYDNVEFIYDYVIGASMFFHSNLVENIGLMPEEYFLYYEDIDWCFKAKNYGFVNLTCFKSVIYHKQGGSTGLKYRKKTKYTLHNKYMYINYKKFYKKYFKKYSYKADILLVKQMLSSLFRFQVRQAFDIFRVIFAFQR